jgi:radical SAM superfamily enzyme YgiQ (UPF0313 family)
MKITLVLCPFWVTEAPPLGIAYLAAYLKSKNYAVSSFDFNIELYSKKQEHLLKGWDLNAVYDTRNYVFNRKFLRKDVFLNREIDDWVDRINGVGSEVICFSVYQQNIIISLELARRIKVRDSSKKIIFGGPSCRIEDMNYFHQLAQCSDVVDAFVIGDGEETLYDLLDIYQKKRRLRLIEGVIIIKGLHIQLLSYLLKRLPINFLEEHIKKKTYLGPRGCIKNLDKLPYPDFGGFPLQEYTTGGVYIQFSRGCPGRCVFCQDRHLWTGYIHRSPENIFAEMKLRKSQGFHFLVVSDLLINGNLKMLDTLCTVIIRNKFNFSWCGPIKSDARMDAEFFRKLRKAGYQGGNFSVESGSQDILNRMHKGHNVRILEKNLKDMALAGLKPSINLIIGFPGENEKTIKMTRDFIFRNRKYISSLYQLEPLLVLPESDIYTNHKKYGIRLGSEYSNWTSLNNDYEWRVKQCKKIYEYAHSLNIRIECSQFKKEMEIYREYGS